MRTTAAKTAWVAQCAAIAVLALGVTRIARAQAGQSAGPNLMVSGNEMAEREDLSNMDALGDKDEIAAFKAFQKEAAAAKRIQLGNNFLKKYPKSKLAERVDIGMMNAYDSQQDWNDTYRFADSALALKPDDVDALTTVSWTIPHVITPNDSDAEEQLDKAEKYAKHAIEVLATMAKPPDMNQSQFEATKAKRLSQAHSALGLVYFRRGDYDDSARELQVSTKDNPTPDATDLYVLGVDLQNLKRYSEAADAYGKCSAVAGPLQGQCKQSAASAKALASVTQTK